MGTPEGLIEARRAVLRALRDVETWEHLLDDYGRFPMVLGSREALQAAHRAASNVLAGCVAALADAQADANEEAKRAED
jgi:hypothetical protein